MAKKSAYCRTGANKAEGISQVPFWLEKFSQALFNLLKLVKMDCERLAKPKLKKNTFAIQFLTCEFFAIQFLTCEFFATLRNSPYVIFRYFPTKFLRFLFQDILCNYPFSSCNQLKIFLDIIS